MRRPQTNWKQILLIAVVLIGAIGLIAVLNRANESAITVDTSETMHDHDGDGKPDHGDGAH